MVPKKVKKSPQFYYCFSPPKVKREYLCIDIFFELFDLLCSQTDERKDMSKSTYVSLLSIILRTSDIFFKKLLSESLHVASSLNFYISLWYISFILFMIVW